MNDSMTNSTGRGITDAEDTESRDILFLSGGAALMLLGAGLVLSHPYLRRNAKAALSSLMPDLQEPLKAGVRGVLPDLERYLRLKGM
jgi:hypothetical protein